MRKSLLKTIVAAAVVGATMAITSVAAMAASTTWVYENDGLDFPEAFGTIEYDSTATLTGSSDRKATFSENIFGDTNVVAGKTGLDISKQTVDTGRIIKITPTQTGRYEFFAVRTDGSSTKFRTYVYDAEGAKTQITEVEGCGRDSLNVEPIILDATAGTTYAFYGNSSSGCALFAVRFSDEFFPAGLDQVNAKTSKVGGSTETWVYENDALDFPEAFGTIEYDNTATLTGSSDRKATFSENIFGDTNVVAGKTGLDISKQTVDTGRIIKITPSQDGQYEFFAVRTDGSSTKFRTYVYDAEGAKTQITEVEGCGRDSLEVEPIVLNATAGTTYAFYGNSSSGCALFAMRFTSSDAVDATTPAVTLENPALNSGKIVVTGNFNAFSTDYYQVDKITLKAASAKSSPDSLAWANLNITKVKDNGDGTFTFTVTLKNTGKNARYQAVIEYSGSDEATTGVNVTDVASNVVEYTAS